MPSSFFGTATVLGIGVVFESNFAEPLKAALEIFRNCDDGEGLLPESPVYIVITAGHDTHTPIKVNRAHGTQLHIADDGISVLADGERGRASCSFSFDVVGGELFREAVRTTALFLATQRGRIPVHASAVMIGDCAFVLAGRSGSGKSTLALAGNRLGLPVLAEDTVFVQLDPTFRLWGLADHIHVFEKDAPTGVEARTRLRSGRIKYAIAISATSQSAPVAALCVIVRGDHVLLDRLSPDDAVSTLIGDPEPGYDLFAGRMEEAIRAIAAGGCWQLTLSRDPDAAIAMLMDAFEVKAQRRLGDDTHV